jgi:K(+)-stimulated pyrophosphate-energized sodium pump
LAQEIQQAQEVQELQEVIRPAIPSIWWIAPAGALLALLFAFKFYKEVAGADQGDPEMIEIANYVREGAMAYLKRS